MGRVLSKYQTEDYDYLWKPTAETEYSGYEESTGSFVSKKKRKKETDSNYSEEEESQLKGP